MNCEKEVKSIGIPLNFSIIYLTPNKKGRVTFFVDTPSFWFPYLLSG